MRLPAGNRCGMVSPVTHALGTDPLIDDFEPAPTDTATCRKILALDGRQGAWAAGKDSVSPSGVVSRTLEPPGPGGAPGSTRATHMVGSGLNSWGSYLAVSLAPCYDASKYKGISFWMKGDPKTVPYLKVSVTTPVTTGPNEGGACEARVGEPNGECHDNFTVDLFAVSPVWTRYAITWRQLAQNGWGQLAGGGYRPETEIIGINIAPGWEDSAAPNKSFDFWIDDVSFDIAGPFTPTGFTSIISKAKFDATFAARRGAGAVNPLFANAYGDLTAALDMPEFSRIGREGSLEDRKREIAAFLGHVVQETGSLRYAVELSPSITYCDPANKLYPCAPGQTYIGRGPLQISWNYNYGAASQFLGLGNQLLTSPGMVVANGGITWKTSVFVWMAWKNTGSNVKKVGSHFRFLSEGFGATIRAINGALECPTSPAANNRIAAYKAFCAAIGVTGCDQNLTCPPQ
jgi:chitinase